MAKVLVIGSRTWTDIGKIRTRLQQLPDDTMIISGAARGADQLAAYVAKNLGFYVVEFPAQWTVNGKFNRLAGFERNIQMLEENPSLCIAFHSDESPGTAHTIKEARKRNIPVEVIH